MPNTTIEQLEIEIQSDSSSAVKGIESLSVSLSKLKGVTKGGLGLSAVANQINKISTAAAGVSATSVANIGMLSKSLERLRGLGEIKISSSVANQIGKLSQSANALSGTDFSGIGKLTTSLAPLNSIQKSSGLQSTITQLNKLPALADRLRSVNWGDFASQIARLSNSLTPLVNKLEKVAPAMAALTPVIRKSVNATKQIPPANKRAATSYINLWAKVQLAKGAIIGIASKLAGMVKNSNDYIESMNLFSVSMGKYAGEAYKYAQNVSELLGIDPAEWMQKQGVFNTIISGFGVASDKAYLMSKNLTQLGYDLSSFFNISVEEAMTKIQSGISGELEPLRQLGYDLSVARLQQEALNLGITKSVSKMTQAEKSQLRYYAIIKQVSMAHGDMARTIKQPANQIRVLKAQLTLASRAIGNLFIPMLNAILPYAIAAAKAVRYLADQIAKLFGITMPNVDFNSQVGDLTSGLTDGSDQIGELAKGADDTSENLKDATKQAKKLQRTVMGFDELNLLNKKDDSLKDATKNAKAGLDDLGLGDDLNIPLPEYDFLKGLEKQNDDLIERLKRKWKPQLEWIKAHFDDILDIVKTIGASILAWKLGKAFIDGLAELKNLKNLGLGEPIEILLGGILMGAGFKTAFDALKDQIQNGIDAWNLGRYLVGSILGVAGTGLLAHGIASLITKAFKDTAVSNAIQALGGPLGVALLAMAVVALGFAISGAVVAARDIIKNGINGNNFAQLLVDALVTVGSTAILGRGIANFITKAFAGTAVANAIEKAGGSFAGAFYGAALGAIVAGAGMFFAGVWSEIHDGLNGLNVTMTTVGAAAVGAGFGALFGGPVGALVGAGIGAIVGLIATFGVWLYQHWDEVKAKAAELKENIAAKLEEFKTKVGELPEKIGEAVTSVVDWFKHIPERVGEALTTAKETVSEWVGNVKEAIASVPEKIHELGQAFIDFAGDLGYNLGLALGHAVKWVADMGEKFVKAVPEVFDKVVTWFKELPGKIGEAFTNALTKVNEWIINVKTAITDNVPIIINNVVTWFGELPGKIGTAFTNVVNKVKTWASDMLTEVKTYFPQVVAKILKYFKELPEKLFDLGKDIWNGLVNGLKSAWSTITKACKNFVSGFVKGFKDGLGIHSPSTVFESIGGYVVAGLSKGLGGMGKAFTDVFNTVGGFIQKFGGDMYTWGSDMMGNLVSGIQSGLNQLQTAVQSAAEKIWSYLHHSTPEVGPLAHDDEWMPDMMKGLAKGIADNEYLVEREMKKLTNGMNISADVQANASAAGYSMSSVGGDSNGFVDAVYSAVLSAMSAQNNEDSGTPIIVQIGNEQLGSFIAKSNRRNALISGGRA